MSFELYSTTPTLENKRSGLDLEAANQELARLTPLQRVEWAAEKFDSKLILSTTFGPTAPLMLKLVTQTLPDVPVINIRHGYETPTTLEHAKWYEDNFGLNLRVYDAPFLRVPDEGTPEFEEFQRKIKVQPFQKAVSDFQPTAYFSGVMRWQTEERQDLPFIEEKGSVYGINPVLDISEKDVDVFFELTGLPKNGDYFDPTKGQSQQLECQLNTTSYK